MQTRRRIMYTLSQPRRGTFNEKLKKWHDWSRITQVCFVPDEDHSFVTVPLVTDGLPRVLWRGDTRSRESVWLHEGSGWWERSIARNETVMNLGQNWDFWQVSTSGSVTGGPCCRQQISAPDRYSKSLQTLPWIGHFFTFFFHYLSSGLLLYRTSMQ